MNKILSIFVVPVLALTFLLTPAKVFSVEIIDPACEKLTPAQRSESVCPDSSSGTNPLFGKNGILTTVVQVLTIFVGIAAVITIIIAGLRMIISSGEPSSVNTARNAIFYALIGLVVALVSQSIIIFVLRRISVT